MMHADGSETKGFNIRDGAAMVWAQRVGLTIGLLSARSSRATTQRAAQLAIRLVVQGVSSKLEAYTRILRDTGVPESAVAYMGDDLIDLPVLARAGLSAAPADAAAEVRERVDWVSNALSGRGAVREFIEMVLRSQDRWNEIVRGYTAAE
jgi:3-deoxy-D-manno-octulosonate 8-phosphate phosphatase (KDO 8-P phosphatase)